ncbi:MAG TPA: DinB family protein [Gemmatimonadales bacterium]|nr:DinB family protein [Gemmatimonadales bacterium]
MATESLFSNPAGAAVAAGQAYTKALLDVIGDRDPLPVLAELVPWVDQRVATLDDAAVRRPEKPGKWSVLEVVQHLADSEMVYGYRVRMILSQDTPPIPGYDQDAWARTFRYRELPVAETLAQLRALRPVNLRLYRSLDATQRARAGLHSERGPESVEHIVRLMAAHDLVHRRQIDRIIAAQR